MADKKPLVDYSGTLQEITSGDALDVNTGKIKNVVDPTADQEAATLKYTVTNQRFQLTLINTFRSMYNY